MIKHVAFREFTTLGQDKKIVGNINFCEMSSKEDWGHGTQ